MARAAVRSRWVRVRDRRVCPAIVAAVLLVLVASTYATLRPLIAKVEGVSDGDTIMAFTSNQTKLRIRLLGIDAPQIPQGPTQAALRVGVVAAFKNDRLTSTWGRWNCDGSCASYIMPVIPVDARCGFL